MKSRLRFKPISSGLLALCLSTLAYGHAASNTANTSNNQGNSNNAGGGDTTDQYPDLVEIDPFGGVATHGQVMRGLDTKLVDGGVAGGRVTVNPGKWFGIEAFFDFEQANVEFRTPSNGGVYPAGTPQAGLPIPTYSFGSRDYLWGLGPVVNLRPRGSKLVPYLTVGVDGINFVPTDTAKSLARQPATNAAFYSANLNSNLQVGLNYGGGIKFHLSDHFGLRVDARGFWSRNPTYGLPNYNTGGIYIPAHDKINSFQGTVGLVFFLGQSKCPPMPPAPPPPPALPTPTITGAEGTICQNKPVTLHANITPAAGRTVTYAWTLNGAPQSGATGPDFTFTPNNTGTFNVQVTVTDTTPPPPPMERPKKFPLRCWVQPPAPQPPAPVTATASLTVNDTAPSVSNVTANPNTLVAAVDQGTHTSTLTATATPGPCCPNLTYKWTVSEGSLTNDTTPTATFDASTLNFEGGQNQTKTVTATVTVTDDCGRTGSGTTTITVNYTPPFVRLDDVIFAKNNARVNNCGKRILIDDTAPRLSSGDYDIVLVGHRDTDEAENVPGARARHRGRRPAPVPLDEQRVLNAAAVLSGGTATCGHVDPARIRVDWVGTDQTSDTRPGLCGTSNVKERRTSKTSAADKNRRVEVYLVPHGSTAMPPAVKNIKPLPEDQVKALGCPK
jgi:outer membrane protein OmpA-like peptidoglycan-associated protein